MTPSPVYPCLQVQVLIPAATLVQTANSEHPPLDRLHKSSSERQKEKDEESVITLKDRFNDAVCVCVCLPLQYVPFPSYPAVHTQTAAVPCGPVMQLQQKNKRLNMCFTFLLKLRAVTNNFYHYKSYL